MVKIIEEPTSQKAVVWLPIAKATSQKAVVWLPIAKATSQKAVVWLPSPGLIGEAGARLCAVAKATSQKKKAGQVTFEGDKVSISLNYSLCTNCGLCISNCPHKVLIWQEKTFKGNNKIDIVQISDLSKCNACGRCQEICKFRAIVIK